MPVRALERTRAEGDGRPNLSFEKAAGRLVAGLDEVGRGPLAGPVVAAAVILPRPLRGSLAGLLDDSKKLSPVQRETAFAALLASKAVIGVGAASVGEILRLNILHASMLAMRRAFSRLRVPPDAALVDGNRDPGLPCRVTCVIGGDARSLSIAAASIVAKVIRDRAMARLHVRYPGYGWLGNAGYPSVAHRAALHSLGPIGPTVHHRAEFGTVRLLLNSDACK
jgi:ribonuclease HII